VAQSEDLLQRPGAASTQQPCLVSQEKLFPKAAQMDGLLIQLNSFVFAFEPNTLESAPDMGTLGLAAVGAAGHRRDSKDGRVKSEQDTLSPRNITKTAHFMVGLFLPRVTKHLS
jgi:hypothetical protein